MTGQDLGEIKKRLTKNYKEQESVEIYDRQTPERIGETKLM